MTDAGEADRELRAEISVAASPDRVWQVLTDLSRMREWSPETVRMLALKRGGLRVGQWYLGINRRKAVVWPTRNVVVEVRPGRRLAWDTTSSGARWIYDLHVDGEGTRVVHTRPVPRGRLTLASSVVASSLLGGATAHADELEAGMQQTVERLRAAIEG